MKRFLAFAFDSYSPSGGGGDFVADFDSMDEASEAVSADKHDYLDVLDTSTGEWVSFKFERGAGFDRHWRKNIDAQKAHEAS